MPTVDVAEAARILNVTPDAIRARLRRGTLLGGKRGNEWFVQLPADAVGQQERQQDTSRDTDTTQQDVTEHQQDALLVEQLRGENEYLRDQLSQMIRQMAAERERADVLHREALGRIEALTATVSERQDATAEPEKPEEGVRNAPESVAWPESVGEHARRESVEAGSPLRLAAILARLRRLVAGDR